MKPSHMILASMLAATAAVACATDPANPPVPRHERRPPPPPDPALCKDKAAGASIEATTQDGRTIKGTCQLVFLPDRPPGDARPR